MTTITRSNTELFRDIEPAVPARADDAPTAPGALTVGSSAVGPRADRIMRFGKTALPIILIVVAVTAIVVVTGAIWIACFHL
jgi:hypothetical protein